uniref:Uncharacterized protein n=1 Tax=Anopheles quadriannulatus TaxID=34691 RepID=A0A182XTP4_ANOQN
MVERKENKKNEEETRESTSPVG